MPPGGQWVDEAARLAEKPGNPAVTAGGRLIFTVHPLNRPTFKLMERRPDGGGGAVLFPDPERSRAAFDDPLGIRAAAGGTFWILDMGDGAGAAAHPAARPLRLVGRDPRRNAAAREIALPVEVLGPTPGRRTSRWTSGAAPPSSRMRCAPTRRGTTRPRSS